MITLLLFLSVNFDQKQVAATNTTVNVAVQEIEIETKHKPKPDPHFGVKECHDKHCCEIVPHYHKYKHHYCKYRKCCKPKRRWRRRCY